MLFPEFSISPSETCIRSPKRPTKYFQIPQIPLKRPKRNSCSSNQLVDLAWQVTYWTWTATETNISYKIHSHFAHPVEEFRSYSSSSAIPDLLLEFLSKLKMMKLNRLALWSIWSLKLKTAKFTEITNMSTELNFFILTSLITFNSRVFNRDVFSN